MSQKNNIPIVERSVLPKEVTSKDLTRKQLFQYLFGDFVRGFYIVACMFLDILVIGELYKFIPSPNLLSALYFSYFGNPAVLPLYVFMLTVLLEVVAVHLEVKIYRKFWKRKAAAEAPPSNS
ncbi:MAG: hypothetical protein QW812_00570 [Thermoplasmataceae archaeon]